MTGQQVSRVMVFKPHSGDGPTMTKHQPIAGDVVLVAIDVAKARNEVLIAIPGQTRRRRWTVLNTRAEHDRLVSLLSELKKPVSCGFEATGNYHRPIAGGCFKPASMCV